MQYKTLKQQCKELLAAGRYDELQALLSTERAKIAAEMEQSPTFIPPYLPRFLVGLYVKLLPLIWTFRQDRPSLLREEARLAHQNRRIQIIIEMEQNLLAALNQEANTLQAEVRALEEKLARERQQVENAGDEWAAD